MKERVLLASDSISNGWNKQPHALTGSMSMESESTNNCFNGNQDHYSSKRDPTLEQYHHPLFQRDLPWFNNERKDSTMESHEEDSKTTEINSFSPPHSDSLSRNDPSSPMKSLSQDQPTTNEDFSVHKAGDEEEKTDSQTLEELLKEISQLSLSKDSYRVELKPDSQPSTMTITAEMSSQLSELIEKYLTIEEELPVKPSKDANSDKKLRRKKKESRGYNQKNFPKKIGDQFCDHINQMMKIKTNKLFKDKTSWKLLNTYLAGDSKVTKAVDHKAFTKCFVEFMANYDVDAIQNAKTKEMISKICYTINAMTLGLCCKEILSKIQNGEPYSQIRISKSWPKAVVEIWQ